MNPKDYIMEISEWARDMARATKHIDPDEARHNRHMARWVLTSEFNAKIDAAESIEQIHAESDKFRRMMKYVH